MAVYIILAWILIEMEPPVWVGVCYYIGVMAWVVQALMSWIERHDKKW